MNRAPSILGLLIVLAGCSSRAKPGEIKVAAASDLATTFPKVARAFEAKTGNHVTFSFGSSGNFAKQIAEGAPFDLFASANATFVDDTTRAGACDAATKALYARGRIVLWTKDGVAPARTPADLADARFTKVAIANPRHAPYGKAAQQALEATGAWAAVQPKLVFGENIQQTLQFALSGNVEAAIVSLSLVKAQFADKEGKAWNLVDESLHQPLDQALVVCKHGKNAAIARQFAAFVSSPDGRAILSRDGFTLPGQSTATH